MNISSAKEQIKDTVEAYLKKDEAGMHVIAPVHQRPVFLLGAPGIGKTAIMEQVAAELGIGIVSYSMTHHTRQSALGLPRIEHHNFEGFEYEASEYTMSEIVSAIYTYMERSGLRQGILFLDEINCVSETLYPSMLQFLQFKTFGKHKVPEDWVIVCAGNPPEYNRSVHEFDIVTLDRMREIDVEPEYAAWKNYAASKGLHPAVTTFLEAKKDCFYKVESRPGGGKAFVTARGWEDLAQIISLYESMEKKVNRDLIVQFLRDEDTADAFAVYYQLFQKYRSDYQVGTILAGEATEQIMNRAREAEFDERVALLGLILDYLAGDCAKALDQEGVVVELRDILRAAKPELLAGGTVADTVGKRLAEREAVLGRRIESNVASKGHIRKERLVLGKLRVFCALCDAQNKTSGAAAFEVIQDAYKEEVAKIKPLTDAANAEMSNAFDFMDRCLSTREMLVFMAELTTRKATTQFVAHYGNEKYYAHNESLQVDAARMGLVDRVAELEEQQRSVSLMESRKPDMGGAVGLSLGGRDEGSAATADFAKQAKAASEWISESAKATDANADMRAATASSAAVAAAGSAKAPTLGDLKKFYGTKQFEYGFTSICKMLLPTSEMKGKKVLDICSRRGRGVYKISAMVGNEGKAIGVDWSEAYIDESKDGINRAWHESGLKGNNMEFHVAYPEDLMAAGLGNSTLDIVYVNNVITLFYDQERAIKEFSRVLKPGGLLVLETVFADRERNAAVVDAARELGNSIQAAATEADNRAWLEAAGFGEVEEIESYVVAADRGYKATEKVETVAGDEDVQYRAVCLYARKN